MKMTLIRRLMMTCVALLLLCCVVAGVSVFCMLRTQEAVSTLSDTSVPGLYWAGKLKAVAKDQRIDIIFHLMSSDPDEMRSLEAKVEQTNADLAEGRRNYPKANAEDVSQIETMARDQQQFMDVWYKIRDLSRAGDKKGAWDLYNNGLMQATLGRRKVEDYLASTSQERGFSTAASARTIAQRGIPAVLIISTIAILVGIILTLSAAKYVNRRLKCLTEVAQHLADGDVAVATQLFGDSKGKRVTSNSETDELAAEMLSSDDEIGELARSFASMVSYLGETAEVSTAIASGNLATQVHPRSTGDALGHAFVQMNDGLGSLVMGVRDSAVQVASGAAQVADASGALARVSVAASSAIDEVSSTMQEMSINVQNMVRSTQTQSASVSQTSASIEEMVASIQRVADTSKTLVEISQRSREAAQNGILCMDKTTAGLNRIDGSIRSSAENISVLGRRAEDIGKIIEVIDDVAEQTNLLALNAAIEAARAGEHGLGFAIVADEIRKLAEKSGQSTNEISELIQSIQSEVHKAVGNVEKSAELVNEGLTLGADASAALRTISQVVGSVFTCAEDIGTAMTEQSNGSAQIALATTRLNEITREITSSVEEESAGAQGVVKAMQRMRELVQQSGSGSSELAASSEQMSKMSTNLLGMMDRFNLPSAKGTAPRKLLSRSTAAGR